MSSKKLNLLRRLFTCLAYIGLFTPIVVVLIKNFDIYFTENKSAFSVGIGGVLLGLGIVLLLKYGFKTINKVFWSTLFLIIVVCLETILKDAVIIAFAVEIGVVAFVIFEMPMNYFKERCKVRRNEKDRMVANQEYQEEQAKIPEQNKKRSRC